MAERMGIQDERQVHVRHSRFDYLFGVKDKGGEALLTTGQKLEAAIR